MSEFILHQYQLSPFSEKVRLMLGYAGLDWRAVTVGEVPPRPALEMLTGGYRRIPVAQIGADVFCDTRLIAREIAQLANRPELALENNSDEVQAFVRETDLEMFLACIIATSGPGMLVKLARNTSIRNTLRFLKDRVGIGRNARVPSMSLGQAREKLQAHLERLEKMLEQEFLFGSTPCIADFSAYHSLWYVRDLTGKPLVQPFERVNAWMDRMKAFGHGNLSEMTADQALEEARKAEPRAIGQQGSDPLLGRTVSIAPEDYARDPVVGTLVAVQPEVWTISRATPELGALHVHLPRRGFRIRDV